MTQATEQQFEQLLDGIKKHAPLVATLFDNDMPLIEHVKTLQAGSPSPVHAERQLVIQKAITDYCARVYDRTVNLKRPLVQNIVDHHTPLNHPLLLTTNIVAHIDELTGKVPAKEPIVVFTTSLPSQDNFFSRGGFQFNGRRVTVFSKKQFDQSSYFMDKHDFQFVNRAKESKRWREFNPEQQDFLLKMETQLSGWSKNPAANTFNDQVGLINHEMWKLLFADDTQSSLPDLLYFSNEDLMLETVDSWLFENSMITQALFDDVFRNQVLERFNKHIGCWDTDGKKGTHFFWRRSAKNEAMRMIYTNEALESADGYSIALEPAALATAVKNKEIVPGLFIIYGWLSFWCGVRPLVGYGSMNYMSRMKEAWLDVIEDASEHERIASVDTTGFICGFNTTFGRNTEGLIESLYGLDVISRGGLNKEYLIHLSQMTVAGLLKPGILDIYDSYVPASDKVPHTLKTADLMDESYDWIT